MHKGICDKGFIWNPRNCKYKCDKSCDLGEYLDYKNCKCRKKLVHILVEECSENIDETELHPTELHAIKMIYNSTLNDFEKIYRSCERSSCTIYEVFFVLSFIVSISTSSAFIYFYWYLIV